jgi:Chaperone of endosialidase
MNPLIQLRQTTPAILVALACFGLSPMAQALLPPPPPDGGYPGENTAEGHDALFSLTTGRFNTAIGFDALFSNTRGYSNTAIGFDALFSNTDGNFNTAIGFDALFINTTGSDNTAVGRALLSNTTGSDNVANGALALAQNTTGSGNTANGALALEQNTTGSGNTATGDGALDENTTGNNNTADGVIALENTTGSNNIALGANAGFNLTTGSNNIDIGNAGVAAESNTIRIGSVGTQTKAFIAGIMGSPGPRGMPVFVNAHGQLGTFPSSARFKDEIMPMDKASEAILALKPVTFCYKREIDADRTAQFGLVAEEVEKVNPDLVVKDADGKVYTVRYDAVNAMLLNEFLKEHKKTEKLEATVASLITTVKEQAAQIQKVSPQLEASKPAPQVVNNP